MRIPASGDLHLTFCLNAFPSPRPDDLGQYFNQVLLPIRDLSGCQDNLGWGLWLDRRSAARLADPVRSAAFCAGLARHQFYLFTLNGFPYGAFHDSRIKEKVFYPDWTSPERLHYTLELARVLGTCSPPDRLGSISTVPLGERAAFHCDHKRRQAAGMLVRAVAELDSLRKTRGITVVLALEPEPGAALETGAEASDFIEKVLLPEASVTDAGFDDQTVLRHIGICVDLAHAAVMEESVMDLAAECHRRNIRIAKVHISAAVSFRPTRSALEQMHLLADPVYLHQLRARLPDGGIAAWRDLPDALRDPRLLECDQARIHFHVPLTWQGSGDLRPVAGIPPPEIVQAVVTAGCRHFEVETYTYAVLPPELRPQSPISAAAAELRTAANHLKGYYH
ncbi:MAG TPA: hypothetical protein EYP62_00980 [Kiritimatiellae bacterium]|nr:hypothetical protein [Kiritimatiellia bacterium]